MKAQTKHKSRTYLMADVRGWLCATPTSPHTHTVSSTQVCIPKSVYHTHQQHRPTAGHVTGTWNLQVNPKLPWHSSRSRLSACSSTCDRCLHQSSSKPRYELHDISRSSRPSGLLPCFSFFFPAILVCFFSSAKDTTIIPYIATHIPEDKMKVKLQCHCMHSCCWVNQLCWLPAMFIYNMQDVPEIPLHFTWSKLGVRLRAESLKTVQQTWPMHSVNKCTVTMDTTMVTIN